MTLSGVIFDSSKIIGQFIFDILYFPLWWYTSGFIKILTWSKNFLQDRWLGSGLGVWLKNIFTPMYGQRDWAGMLISFITRLVQIVVRSLLMIFWLTYILLIIMLWLFLPLVILYQIAFQLDLIASL